MTTDEMVTHLNELIAGADADFRAKMKEAALDYAVKLAEVGLPRDLVLTAMERFFTERLLPWYADAVNRLNNTVTLTLAHPPTEARH